MADLVKLTNDLVEYSPLLDADGEFIASLVGLEEDDEINRLIKLMKRTKEKRKKKKLNKRIIKLIADTLLQEVK